MQPPLQPHRLDPRRFIAHAWAHDVTHYRGEGWVDIAPNRTIADIADGLNLNGWTTNNTTLLLEAGGTFAICDTRSSRTLRRFLPAPAPADTDPWQERSAATGPMTVPQQHLTYRAHGTTWHTGCGLRIAASRIHLGTAPACPVCASIHKLAATAAQAVPHRAAA